ncbi:penicillin-binding protein activator [uncultured Tateyamaria sp.]|uniref:penicillin-binding protein activator n=1 Tax=uncultured Tateyamaria sp. TaxID=455651 RepID=UPI001DCFEE4E|nr:penicillin-binding protein activator [uncultured Tateyamaria sp.]MCB4379161.1 penicillin-binding protein activator [Synechococcus sp. MU1644]
MFAFFKTLRKAARRVIVPLAALALAACDPAALGGLGGSTGGPRIDTSQPVPVALLVPRGSGQASDELLANNLENAARLAMRDLQGVQIDLRVYGTAGNAGTAASQAAQAVNDGAQIIIGPLYADAANAAGVAVAPQNVNVLAFSNNTSIAGGNVFVLGSTFENIANRLVTYAARQGKDRVVVVHAQDVAGQIGRNAIQQAISRSGATLVGTVDYPLSQQGLVAAVPRVKSAVDNSAANAVFMTATPAAGLPLLSQLLPEAGINPTATQYVGITRWDLPPQTLELPGVQGGWFALPDPARSSAFQAQYQAAYGNAPHPVAGLAFDGIAAIGALAAQGNSGALTGAALTQGSGFQGASGIFRLRPDGTNERGLAIATVRDNKVVVIDAAPRGFGGAGF